MRGKETKRKLETTLVFYREYEGEIQDPSDMHVRKMTDREWEFYVDTYTEYALEMLSRDEEMLVMEVHEYMIEELQNKQNDPDYILDWEVK